MIKPEHVPEEVIAALVNALYDNRVDVAWSDARAATAAALNAWPGMDRRMTAVWKEPYLILPLTPTGEK